MVKAGLLLANHKKKAAPKLKSKLVTKKRFNTKVIIEKLIAALLRKNQVWLNCCFNLPWLGANCLV